MRTTIEIKDEHRAKLLELAARRGQKGFSLLIDEAIQQYLNREAEQQANRRRALQLRGRLSQEQADRLMHFTATLRASWR